MKVKNSPSISPIFAVLKRRLKARGLKYRDLARELDVAETSVKRWFSKESLTLKQLTDIADILSTTAADIMQEAVQPPPHYLTAEQEQELLSDLRLLLVTVCVLLNWSVDDIMRHYNLTEAECVKYLLVLDRLRIIDLLPQQRIQIRIARNFNSLPGSPLWHFTRGPQMHEFLDSWPQDKQQSFIFLCAMLTTDAMLQFEEHALRLKQKLHELHMESLNAPFEQRHPYVGYIAHREWEMKVFAKLKRKP